ncbi:MAG: DUF3427 domain-containing protein [Armatimonadetes bacterium]|nr:DUF3427 domain-containing protein [Armatimonadota bacterium]
MSNADQRPGRLVPGLYEELITAALLQELSGLPDPPLYEAAGVDMEAAHSAMAQHLAQLLGSALTRIRGPEASAQRLRLADRVIASLAAELGPDAQVGAALAEPLRQLLSVGRQPSLTAGDRPDTPLSRSALLTGTRLDPSLASQLSKEIASSDRVDILCSFIKWSGLRLLLDALKQLTSSGLPDGPRLRVISTSYMGATDPKAIEWLSRLPNTQVRVSYDTSRTRLHAKAYLCHRETGFGSTYVGSANLSRAALSEGLEWTSKISQYELPHLWRKIEGTFETYWNDEEFEEFTEASGTRLREAILRERESGGDTAGLALFDLRPYPYQQEILDAIATEREVQGKRQHLVVAATGTGKTMVAAFDYRRAVAGGRPSLLYVAHREEILSQAIGTFRAVLRDHNFGDLLFGGRDPEQTKHLFCSIQSYNSRELWRLDPEQYQYIVVDEFHHAAAPSYSRLLEHVRPAILLGLTATPERCDGLDVLGWFGGEASAEIRLPDAIGRRLLCPFQYFGVSDCVDLDSVRWQRGGYRAEDLDGLYTGNDVRAGLVVDKVIDVLNDPAQARAIGFCVSVAHAEYMARFFNERGLPAVALSAQSPSEERRSARERLVRREVNFVFVVDLYNEGVDIPEIDTVLFLRPTESLTVFLQQLGRGLRMHADKECLTVLDFIGAHRREFRFAARFRALSNSPTAKLDREIEDGFPHLPSGCAIRLERVAQQRVLSNVRSTLALRRSRVLSELRDLARYLGRPPAIREALEHLDTTLDALLRNGAWSRLLSDAGLGPAPEAPDEDQLASGLRRLAHIDDPQQLRFLLHHLSRQEAARGEDAIEHTRLAMMHVTLWGSMGSSMTVEEAEQRLRENASFVSDIRALLEYRLAHTHTRPLTLVPVAGPLAVHALYSRDEILVGLGRWSMDKRPDFREGVLHLKDAKVDALFVTLLKAKTDYSPTTMYEDYAISDRLFHWQSQSTTASSSETGQRYIKHKSLGYTPLLFVRERKSLPSGQASPYAFLGAADYVSHTGDRPMSIIWHLQTPMPARLLRSTCHQMASA